jgi:hypothetical protein
MNPGAKPAGNGIGVSFAKMIALIQRCKDFIKKLHDFVGIGGPR